mmetsp:Transcript_34018/g.48338  ORF Transcript_34018/g.48338 Transcript_34018/m.48338 type:complete len:454 (+) Transcript_34018:211-1572(+)|eukprot:CAMPEP_0202460938 /NCGR_PEP_ID=MMETSP1360-20130828/46697_1 /ASSEMBLY_ACC=CAM_ASM_000848 /TAXON_ID=515479 /ORGANISM="Licmophora paradoxa, Strain CCMP2313" /LENGTH=453 /DNA_ID=CAMNT_0049082801 /DNA_START=230 /DNA_END=1591 /DNA_ORIENTATION=+
MQRPQLIRRSSSSARSNGNASVDGRSSILLNADLRLDLATPWKISDTCLKPVPPFCPPMDPNCTVFLNDASPSVVAARISSCLKKRSISVEYDEETITASCMTVDRVHFQIHLYRGNRAVLPNDLTDITHTPDFSHAILVEIVRARGDAISFHRHCRSILNAAMAQSSGAETRTPVTTSPFEFPRLIQSHRLPPTKRRAISVASALEHAWELVEKDRVGAQRLGIESIVSLTDIFTSGVELAVNVSLSILGSPPSEESSCYDEIQSYLLQIIQERILPGEDDEAVVMENFASSSSAKNDDETNQFVEPRSLIPVDDTYHGGLLRSLSLRVLSNALSVLSEHEPDALRQLLKQSPLVSREFLQALAEDLLGATRLPAVVSGTRLASAHEAAIVTRILRLIAACSNTARKMLVNPKNAEHPILDTLIKNRAVHHEVLRKETEKTYALLSEHVRTC